MQRCRRNGNRSGIAYAVLGLACVAADDCDWVRAAVLFGASDGLFDRVGHTCEELEAATVEQALTRCGSTWGTNGLAEPMRRPGNCPSSRSSLWHWSALRAYGGRAAT